jgi:hypothetical protein
LLEKREREREQDGKAGKCDTVAILSVVCEQQKMFLKKSQARAQS